MSTPVRTGCRRRRRVVLASADDARVIVLAVVLLITYVPSPTLWLVHLLDARGMYVV
jgi:hypothetical protein